MIELSSLSNNFTSKVFSTVETYSSEWTVIGPIDSF